MQQLTAEGVKALDDFCCGTVGNLYRLYPFVTTKAADGTMTIDPEAYSAIMGGVPLGLQHENLLYYRKDYMRYFSKMAKVVMGVLNLKQCYMKGEPYSSRKLSRHGPANPP